MSSVFILILFCVGLIALFIAGWTLALIATAVHAVLLGRNVKQAVMPLLAEW